MTNITGYICSMYTKNKARKLCLNTTTETQSPSIRCAAAAVAWAQPEIWDWGGIKFKTYCEIADIILDFNFCFVQFCVVL